MKAVKVTLTLEFESEEVDDETLKEAIVEAFGEKAENDELLEVTPKSLRLRKKELDHNKRKRAAK